MELHPPPARHAVTNPGYFSAGPFRGEPHTGQQAKRKNKTSRSGRPVDFDADGCKNRNVVGRAFNKLKIWRGLATRPDPTRTHQSIEEAWSSPQSSCGSPHGVRKHAPNVLQNCSPAAEATIHIQALPGYVTCCR